MANREVPCGSCTECCRNGELIVLHPEDGDNVAEFDTVQRAHPLTGKTIDVIRQRSDGTCYYLGAAGCTIYDRRPVICRAFDCRRMLAMIQRSHSRPVWRRMMSANPVLQAARERSASA